MATETVKIVNILKALASETRLKIIIGLLEKKECNVTLMVKKLGLAQPNVSQHLALLKNAGVIEGYRKGKEICYKVVYKQIEKLINFLSTKIR